MGKESATIHIRRFFSECWAISADTNEKAAGQVKGNTMGSSRVLENASRSSSSAKAEELATTSVSDLAMAQLVYQARWFFVKSTVKYCV